MADDPESKKAVQRLAEHGVGWVMLRGLMQVLVEEGVLTKSQVRARIDRVQEEVTAMAQGLATQELHTLFDDLRRYVGKKSPTKN